MMKHSIGYKAPINVTYYLHNTFVCNNIEQLFYKLSPFNFNQIQALEFIQRAATRYILNHPDLKYNERCTKLTLLPLLFLRDCADLIFFYTCLHGFYEVQFKKNYRHKCTRHNSSFNKCK